MGGLLDAAASLLGSAGEVEAMGGLLDAAASLLGSAGEVEAMGGLLDAAASLLGSAVEVEAAAVDLVDGPGVGFRNFNSASEERSM